MFSEALNFRRLRKRLIKKSWYFCYIEVITKPFLNYFKFTQEQNKTVELG